MNDEELLPYQRAMIERELEGPLDRNVYKALFLARAYGSIAPIVIFLTRPSWDGFGDLSIDGVDQGWTTLADAEAEAKSRGVHLQIVNEADAKISHPRRGA
jgi:hypothetical protein